jgi:hypothetical protein
LDPHTWTDRRDAGPLFGQAIDRHQTIEANAHPTVNAARRTGRQMPEDVPPRGQQRNGHRLTAMGWDRLPIHLDGECLFSAICLGDQSDPFFKPAAQRLAKTTSENASISVIYLFSTYLSNGAACALQVYSTDHITWKKWGRGTSSD